MLGPFIFPLSRSQPQFVIKLILQLHKYSIKHTTILVKCLELVLNYLYLNSFSSIVFQLTFEVSQIFKPLEVYYALKIQIYSDQSVDLAL